MSVAADRCGSTTAYLVPIDQVLGLDLELLPCSYLGLAPFGEEQRLTSSAATTPSRGSGTRSIGSWSSRS